MDGKAFKLHKPCIKLKTESGSETAYYSAVYEEIPEEFRLIAERELNETEANRKEGLRKLKEVMKGENTFMEDELLLAFLRNQKFNIKKSEAKLKRCLPKRRELVKMLADMDMRKIETIIDDLGFGILPYRDKYGRLILYSRPYGLKIEKYTMHDVGVVSSAMVSMVLKYPLTAVTGVVYFGECKCDSLCIFYPYFKTCKEFMPFLLACPIRIPRIEVLNTNFWARWICKIISPLLSRKVVERFCFHGDGYDSLHKLYDPNILPEEFGGTMGQLSNSVYRQNLLDIIKGYKDQGI